MKIYMPYHLGCGNRGCEGIARGSANILDLNKNQIVLFDVSTGEYQGDCLLGLEQVGELKYPRQNAFFEIKRLFSRLLQKVNISFFYNCLMSDYYIHNAKPGDWIFITGGDIYCYEGAATLPNLIVKKAKDKGLRTALFGVSMEKKYLSKSVIEGLKNYDVITTRETISQNTLKELGINNSLFPDPAFSLEPIEFEFPDYFNSNVVGINFSPFTDTASLFTDNMENLISYLLTKGYEICLIPHVLWKGQDDRISINKFKSKYGNAVHVLESEKLSYLQIRYAISKCRYFVGGRTHSVISAYSTSVPCIALGYSVKAIGIAKDIGMPEYTVINSKQFNDEYQLLNAFKRMEKDRDLILKVYSNMPAYKNRFQGLKELFDL